MRWVTKPPRQRFSLENCRRAGLFRSGFAPDGPTKVGPALDRDQCRGLRRAIAEWDTLSASNQVRGGKRDHSPAPPFYTPLTARDAEAIGGHSRSGASALGRCFLAAP